MTKKKVCTDKLYTMRNSYTHPFLCIVSPCHTVKDSTWNYTNSSWKSLSKRKKERTTDKVKQRRGTTHRGRFRDEEKKKSGTTGNKREKKKTATEKKTEGNGETKLTSSCPSCAQSHTSHTPYHEEQPPLEPTNSHLQGRQGKQEGWK